MVDDAQAIVKAGLWPPQPSAWAPVRFRPSPLGGCREFHGPVLLRRTRWYPLPTRNSEEPCDKDRRLRPDFLAEQSGQTFYCFTRKNRRFPIYLVLEVSFTHLE